MPQQPAEVIPLLALGPERPSTPTLEIPPTAPTAEPKIVSPTNTPAHDDSPQPPKKGLVQRFIQSKRPALLVGVVLFLVCVCLAIPIASNSFGHYEFEGCPHNESGVGFWV